MRINKFSLNYIVFIYLCTRWINRRSCSMTKQASSMFKNDFKAMLEAKLQVFPTRKLFELVDLHICMMSLILHFLLEENENNFLYIIWMQYRVFDTYKSCCQIRIITRPKFVLTNFIHSFLCGL